MHRNTRLRGKVADRSIEPAGATASGHGRRISEPLFHQRKVKNSADLSNPGTSASAVRSAALDWNHLDFQGIVSSGPGDETNLARDETILRFGADIRKQPLVNNCPGKRQAAPASKTGDGQMRTLSFMLALAFVLAGASIAGSSDTCLPGVGTFAYSGSPVAASAPETIFVAAR